MSSRTIFFKNCPTERNRGEKIVLLNVIAAKKIVLMNVIATKKNRLQSGGGGVAPIRIITRCDKKLSKRFFGISSKMVSAHPHVSLFF